jgi:hypothetical protein
MALATVSFPRHSKWMLAATKWEQTEPKAGQISNSPFEIEVVTWFTITTVSARFTAKNSSFCKSPANRRLRSEYVPLKVRKWNERESIITSFTFDLSVIY